MEDKEDMDTSFRVDNDDNYKKQWKLTKACNGLIRGLKNIGRGIAYIFQKPYNALSNGFSGAWNATFGEKWNAFASKCSNGWKEIKFKPSLYGLIKQELGNKPN